MFIFLLFLVNANANIMRLYNFTVNIANLEPPRSFFSRTKYETIKLNGDNYFGKTFTFSPLSDNCKNEFEKNNAKDCIKKFPHDKSWQCIYDNCISPSKNQIIYVPITFNTSLIGRQF